MSSLPPYNPRVGDRAVWLLPVLSAADVPRAWEGPWSAAAVDDASLAATVGDLCALARVTIISSPDDLELPEHGWTLVVSAPAFAERMLRRLMSMPEGTARFTMEAGAVSVVQLQPDRAVLLRLNEGRALAGG